MQIQKDVVVRFHYRLSDDSGTELENSREREPLAMLVGHGNIIPGLEQAMMGRSAGESFEVSVPPDQAYGERREDMVQRVPKKYFRERALKPGMTGTVSTRQGPRMVTVLKVGMSVVDVDLNHPLAGQTLRFEVELTEVRAATPEELQHGHAHGSGGHQHE